MILRKPYGFLIKYFKLIHLIITTLTVIIAIKCQNISNFLSKCITDIVNKYDASNYINYPIFLYFIIVLGLFFVIYWLFKYKDKPRKIYILSLFGYIIIAIVLFFTYNYMGSFGYKVINQKTIRLYRDILFICNLFQYFVILIMFIRTLGFNIKKFDFAKDVHELNLTNEDNEEIEVTLGVDTTNITRKIRKQGREFGYYYQEFKPYILAILIIIIMFILLKGYNFYNKNYKVYNENKYVGNNNFINITDSYYSVIDDDNIYIIVKFKTYKKGKDEIFNTGNMILTVGKNKYLPNKNICYKFNKYGKCYKQQYITNQEKSYILVYKIDELNLEKSYILFNDSYEYNYKIKLDIENINN